MSPRRAAAIRDRAGDAGSALREHLLETTERLLREVAPPALRTRRIARAAGVSDGVLYNHFADKDALVLAATVRRFRRLLSSYLAALGEAEGDVEAKLTSVAEAALELHGELLPIVAGLLADPALLRRFLLEIHREHVGAAEIVGGIERLLDAERDAGRVGDVDTSAAADLLVGAVAVAALTSLLGGRPADVKARVRRTVSVLLVGLAPRS